ncbi:retinol dehydrogenase 11-like isoform X3 [Haemaphysalis longicornis]
MDPPTNGAIMDSAVHSDMETSLPLLLLSLGRTLLYVVAAAALCLKLYLTWIKAVYKGTSRMDGKTVIVTGSNSGIGKEAAKELARRGARVILACRNSERAADAARDIFLETGNKVVFKKLDLSSFKSVREFADDVKRTEPRLDVLINNAGIFPDLLKKSAPSRVVNLTSILHHLGTTFRLEDQAKGTHPWMSSLLVYCNSKIAMIAFTRTLAAKLKPHGVTVNAVNPGAVNTTIANKESFLAWIGRRLFDLFGKSPWEGAQTTVYAAVDEDLSSVTGRCFSECTEGWMNWRVLDRRKTQRAFETSLKLVGVEPAWAEELFRVGAD